jgi:hypothetical protein
MDAIITSSWRVVPAALLVLAGATMFLTCLRRYVAGLRRGLREPGSNLSTMQAFRLGVIGLAVAGIGLAWLWQQPWLLALALAVGGEEVLESSICIYALRRAPRVQAAFDAKRPRSTASGPLTARNQEIGIIASA